MMLQVRPSRGRRREAAQMQFAFGGLQRPQYQDATLAEPAFS